MESADLSKEELIDLIMYAIDKNTASKNIIPKLDVELEYIITRYIMACVHFQRNYVIGELDTFKRAACLLVEINKSRIAMDKNVRAAIAVDAALKMCEKPYWNVGEHFDEPKKLDEVDFQRDFANHMEIYNTSRDMLIAALSYDENQSYLNFYINLELFYQLALLLQNRSKEMEKQGIEDVGVTLAPSENVKPKRKFLSFFKKS